AERQGTGNRKDLPSYSRRGLCNHTPREDPSKGIKIGTGHPDLVKRQLEACLKENDELFAWSAAEMPGIDPEVACLQLTIDPRTSAVVQRRRKQSPKKAEAAKKAVKDLLEANFISE
ncbi:hypothetical protein A2U01_0062798, partial [Trifolium medium]|nr:hypothetical protein [Trifolium medium]